MRDSAAPSDSSGTGQRLNQPATRRGATMRLIVLGLTIAIFLSIAIPQSVGMAAAAGEADGAADAASVQAVVAAMNLAFVDHRATDAPPSQWIDSVDDIAPMMAGGVLPEGLKHVGDRLCDSRGSTYALDAETMSQAATLVREAEPAHR
jgi:hypothetical protein